MSVESDGYDWAIQYTTVTMSTLHYHNNKCPEWEVTVRKQREAIY